MEIANKHSLQCSLGNLAISRRRRRFRQAGEGLVPLATQGHARSGFKPKLKVRANRFRFSTAILLARLLFDDGWLREDQVRLGHVPAKTVLVRQANDRYDNDEDRRGTQCDHCGLWQSSSER